MSPDVAYKGLKMSRVGRKKPLLNSERKILEENLAFHVAISTGKQWHLVANLVKGLN